MAVMKSTNTFLIGHLERLFMWWGRAVALHPYPVILTCLLATLTSSLGFLVFR